LANNHSILLIPHLVSGVELPIAQQLHQAAGRQHARRGAAIPQQLQQQCRRRAVGGRQPLCHLTAG